MTIESRLREHKIGLEYIGNMPSRQNHRGRHPQDDRLFGESEVSRLQGAVTDLSYLYSRSYAEDSAVKLVGDRYQLAARQRRAVRSGACSDEALKRRHARRVQLNDIENEPMCIDGYNLLITVESALSAGYLFRGRDGYLRDLASLHGSYRRVDETEQAFMIIGALFHECRAASVLWHFDAPVSNSGRLRALAGTIAAKHGWPWQVELSNNTDKVVAAADGIVVTSDSWILDRADRAAWPLDVLIETYSMGCPVVELAPNS